MIHRRSLLGAVAAIGAAAALLLTPALASAAPPPVTNVTGGNGEAGYYAADDGVTHYRFTETTVTASPSLVNLNGVSTNGAAGTELCNPNTGYTAQAGLWWNGTRFEVSFAYGNLATLTDDPCIDSGLVLALSDSPSPHYGELVGNIAPTTVHITAGDSIYLGVYYDPHGHFGFHTLVIGMADLTQGYSRQFQVHIPTQQFYEFGTGVVNGGGVMITAPANNLLDTFSDTQISCYGCLTHFPISRIHTQGGPYVPGTGLREAQFVNSSSQVLMSPNGSLGPPPAGDFFSMFEGSTSP